jgi:hypothetical protein
MFEGSRTQFFQGSSRQRLEKCLFYSIFYALDAGLGKRCLSPNQYQYLMHRILHKFHVKVYHHHGNSHQDSGGTRKAFSSPPGMCSLTEITQPCIHTCDGLFICQLYLLPDLLEEMDCKEDMPLTLPFASFVSLSQLIIVI